MSSVKIFRHQPGQPRPDMTQLKTWFDAQKHSLKTVTQQLDDLSRQMRAEGKQSLLVIFQALDAAGKDSTIRKVFRYCDPGLMTTNSFKAPTDKEAAHDFMWRCYPHFPAQGRISIFNRSYYEETLVVRVHPHFLNKQNISTPVKKPFWQQRFDFINQVEHHLHHNRTQVVKFMLDVSKETQQQRLIRRYARHEKNWKFNINDIKQRQYWDKYQLAFDDMLNKTSTEVAPWYIIPADDKAKMQQLIATILVKRLKKMKCQRPGLTAMNDKELALLEAHVKSTNQTE